MNKSIKLRTLAKLISCIGLIACLIGCAGYSILTLPEVMNLPFVWAYIIIDLAVMFVFVLVGVLLNLRANAIERAEDLAGEAIDDVDEENECDAECCATCPLADQCDYLIADDIVPKKEEACEETEEPAERAVQYPAAIEKVREKLPAEVGEKVDKVVVVVKENKKAVTIAAAACAAAMLVVQAGKAKKAKRQAENRKKFYEWLG